MPYRLSLLVALTLAPAAAAQTTALATPEPRAAGLASLAVGHDSLAAARLGMAARMDRRSAPTQLAHAIALTDLDRRASVRAIDRALRIDPDLGLAWAARLRDLRRPPAASLFSVMDTRRQTAARRLIVLDSMSALGHAELAERSVMSFRHNRAVAMTRGVWGRTSWQARRAWRSYDDATGHLDALLRADPRTANAHRLAARLTLLADSVAAFSDATQRAVNARPWDGETTLRAAAAAWRRGDAGRADSLARTGLSRLPDPARYTSPVRFVRPTDRAGWEADSLGWADAFWAARDTRRLTPVHDRFLEHLTRMVEADLLFRVAGSHVPGWATDRGDTWVRYGRPLTSCWWLEAFSGGSRSPGEYESWTYESESFLFMDPWMGGQLEFASSSSGEDDVTRARDLAISTVDRYDPVGGREVVQVPMLATAFRGDAGQTDIVLAYGVAFTDVPDETVSLRSIAWAADGEGAVLNERRRNLAVIRRNETTPWSGGRMWAVGSELRVPGGAATLIAEVELTDGTVGQAELRLDVPGFAGAGLQMSDVLLASAVGETYDGVPNGTVTRGDVWVQPLPWAVVSTEAALWVYIETYGLAMDDGASRFVVDAAITPVASGGRLRRGLRRLLGRRPAPGVATGATAGGTSPDDAYTLLLDLSGQPPGRYRLDLTVRDLVAGTAVSRSRDLLLESPRP